LGESKLKSFREILCKIAHLLEGGSEVHEAELVREALSKTDDALDEFLVSNELWGGMGWLADQGFVSDKARRGLFESLMIKLGRLQIEAGKTNIRTEMWVRVFEDWRKAGLRC